MNIHNVYKQFVHVCKLMDTDQSGFTIKSATGVGTLRNTDLRWKCRQKPISLDLNGKEGG